MLRRVALVRTDVSEELSASIIRGTRIGELGRVAVTNNVVPSSPVLVTLMREALNSSETSFLTRATRCNITEDGILHLDHWSSIWVTTRPYWICTVVTINYLVTNELRGF
jgi:hypothetical protein